MICSRGDSRESLSALKVLCKTKHCFSKNHVARSTIVNSSRGANVTLRHRFSPFYQHPRATLRKKAKPYVLPPIKAEWLELSSEIHNWNHPDFASQNLSELQRKHCTAVAREGCFVCVCVYTWHSQHVHSGGWLAWCHHVLFTCAGAHTRQ